jgi:hypothetical protein
MLHETFGEDPLSQTVGSNLLSRFEAGRMSVEDDERLGLPNNRKKKENVRI